MVNFQASTHRRKWIFTPEQLVEKYKAANQQAIETLEKYGVALAKVNDDGSLSYPEIAKEDADKHSRPKAVTVEEEQMMRVFYETKLQEVCNNFHFPHKVQATALIYFKRFYLRWSVMQHEPKNIILTCIYAACKIEENHVSAEELGKGISQDHQLILNNELISLEFDLIVYAPYRSIEGFIQDMEDFCGLKDEQLPMLQNLRNAAKMDVDKIMLTDTPLMFPPEQLALAALHSANQVHRVVDFDRYLGSMLSLLEFCTYHFRANKEILHINRKLKSCWGQSSRDESKKRDKKSKHKSKKSSNEAQPVNLPV
ncbi:hypothetical protein ACLB2K_064943 [Fragaria x ananassa]